MQEDVRLREAARAIYDALFTAAPIGFDEAERQDAFHYRRVMKAAELVRPCFVAPIDA